jgi:hypothetical protein
MRGAGRLGGRVDALNATTPVSDFRHNLCSINGMGHRQILFSGSAD